MSKKASKYLYRAARTMNDQKRENEQLAVMFGGPGVVGVIVLVLLICDFRRYLRARG
jgi:uncharacterized protein YcgL (UPF0745 family)